MQYILVCLVTICKMQQTKALDLLGKALNTQHTPVRTKPTMTNMRRLQPK